jgi:histone H3/H4
MPKHNKNIIPKAQIKRLAAKANIVSLRANCYEYIDEIIYMLCEITVKKIKKYIKNNTKSISIDIIKKAFKNDTYQPTGTQLYNKCVNPPKKKIDEPRRPKGFANDHWVNQNNCFILPKSIIMKLIANKFQNKFTIKALNGLQEWLEFSIIRIFALAAILAKHIRNQKNISINAYDLQWSINIILGCWDYKNRK